MQNGKKIAALLDEFYGFRKTPYEVRIGIKRLAHGWDRLKRNGIAHLTLDSESFKEQKLSTLQNEMKAFTTNFLKQKYCENA